VIDLFAAYLFLVGAVIMLVIAIWSKLAWVAAISAAGWFGAGAFFIAVANGLVYVDLLGIFCVFSGIGSAALPIILKTKKVAETPAEHDRMKEIHDAYDRYNKYGGG